MRFRLRRGRSVVLAAAVVLTLTGCGSGEGNDEPTPSALDVSEVADLVDCPPPTGQPASGTPVLPVLELPCLDGSGGTFALGEAPGRPMVVNLWATWCTTCRDELPLLSQLYDATDREIFEVVGVVTRDGAGLAAEFVQDLDIRFASAFDDNGDLYAAQGLRGLPATYFISADGSIMHAELAPITTYDDLLALVSQHLGVTP